MNPARSAGKSLVLINLFVEEKQLLKIICSLLECHNLQNIKEKKNIGWFKRIISSVMSAIFTFNL